MKTFNEENTRVRILKGKKLNRNSGRMLISKKMAIAVLALSIVFSSIFGFAGGLIADRINPGDGLISSNQNFENELLKEKGTQSGNLSVTGVANLTSDSVVEIRTETVRTESFFGQFVAEGAGSGVIVTQDGFIATNNHVINGANKITVILKNQKSYTAELIGTDEKTDVAVIKIDENGLKPAVFGDSDQLEVGDMAVAIGNPLGALGGTVTDGIISALDREITVEGKSMNLLQTNASINPGNSGGGLFNGRGELIGIVVAKSAGSGVEGLGFAIPANDAKPIIKQIMNYGYVKDRAYLGVTLVEIDSAQAAASYGVDQTGVYIKDVSAGSSAEKGGLKPGDRILSVGSKEIISASDVGSILQSYKVGDEVEIIIGREGKTKSLSVKIYEYNPNNL